MESKQNTYIYMKMSQWNSFCTLSKTVYMCDPVYNCRYHQVDINQGRSLGIGHLFIYLFESRLLSWPGTHQSGKAVRPMNTRDPSLSTSLELRLQIRIIMMTSFVLKRKL